MRRPPVNLHEKIHAFYINILFHWGNVTGVRSIKMTRIERKFEVLSNKKYQFFVDDAYFSKLRVKYKYEYVPRGNKGIYCSI